MKIKGIGAAGGGLAARLKWWNDEASRTGGIMRDGNGLPKMKYHKPGSQNPSKGGIGKL